MQEPDIPMCVRGWPRQWAERNREIQDSVLAEFACFAGEGRSMVYDMKNMMGEEWSQHVVRASGR